MVRVWLLGFRKLGDYKSYAFRRAAGGERLDLSYGSRVVRDAACIWFCSCCNCLAACARSLILQAAMDVPNNGFRLWLIDVSRRSEQKSRSLEKHEERMNKDGTDYGMQVGPAVCTCEM